MDFDFNSDLYAAPQPHRGDRLRPRATAATSASTTALARTDEVPKTVDPGPARRRDRARHLRALPGRGRLPPGQPAPDPAGRGHLRLLDVRGHARRRQRRPPRHLDRLRRPRGRLAVRRLAQRPVPARLRARSRPTVRGRAGRARRGRATHLLRPLPAGRAARRPASTRGTPAGTGSSTATTACNIVNRTLLGMGAQLELSSRCATRCSPSNTRPRRKHTTTQVFWTFVAVCRDALDRLEAEQIAPEPGILRCPGRDALTSAYFTRR